MMSKKLSPFVISGENISIYIFTIQALLLISEGHKIWRFGFGFRRVQFRKELMSKLRFNGGNLTSMFNSLARETFDVSCGIQINCLCLSATSIYDHITYICISVLHLLILLVDQFCWFVLHSIILQCPILLADHILNQVMLPPSFTYWHPLYDGDYNKTGTPVHHCHDVFLPLYKSLNVE